MGSFVSELLDISIRVMVVQWQRMSGTSVNELFDRFTSEREVHLRPNHIRHQRKILLRVREYACVHVCVIA